MTRGLLTVVALCLAVPAVAQQPPAQPTPHLPPVVVEGARVPPERTESEAEAREEIRRVPGSVDLIGERQIDESRAANLKDVLDFTPGVWIRPRFGAADESQISIRGSGLRNNFHLRGVNILLDGFPYGNADGFADFESLELLDGTTVRLDLNYVKNREELPGALTQQELDRTPRRADPANLMLRLPAARNYDYGRGALTIRTPLSETQALEWATQLNYQDLHH